MKKIIPYISGIIILLLFCNLCLQASESIDIEVAKRAAEYHGELIFEKELKICDYELMYWPWGEPAVYVFTLTKEGDFYPQNILLDNTLLKGAYLVFTGKEVEGYTIMAQADRYMTVVVGATKDMSPFIKAHAGLPGHVLALAVMDNPPLEPYWIYGGLFHTFVCSKTEMNLEEPIATEIHLEQTVALKELGMEKVGTIPAYAEELEWGPFTHPGKIQTKEEVPYLQDISHLKEGEKKVSPPFNQEYVLAQFEGCHPASFVNGLKYLEEKRGFIDTGGKSKRELLEWAAICCRTDPDGATNGYWHWKGPEIMFKGLGYHSFVKHYWKKPKKPMKFLIDYAKQINLNFPCSLVFFESGLGKWKEHSVTGIGYWNYNYKKYGFIVLPGWQPKGHVYIRYLGYSFFGKGNPNLMCTYHPAETRKFGIAKPKIDTPQRVFLDSSNNQWKWKTEFSSKNHWDIECYKFERSFYDENGNRYIHDPAVRLKDYYKKRLEEKDTTLTKPPYKKGKAVYKLFFIDDNGHLLEETSTVELTEPDITFYAYGSYQVWGGSTNYYGRNEWWNYYYSIDKYGYTFLGASNSPATFNGNYKYYVIVALTEFSLDAIELQEGTFLSKGIGYLLTGNVHLPFKFDENGNLIGKITDYSHTDYIYGPPDGRIDRVGFPPKMMTPGSGGTYQGFVVVQNPVYNY